MTLAVASITAAVTVLGASPAEAAPAGVHLHVATSAIGAISGHRITVTGQVRAAGVPVPGRSVTVQQRTRGTATWHTLSTVTTSRSGAVQVRTAPLRASKDFRLRMATASGPVTSAVVKVVVATSIAVTATSPLTPTAGDAVVLAGSTSTQLVGKRVYLQLLAGDAWKTVASSQVFTDATYNVYGIATLGGDQQYRAMVKPGPGRAGAITEPVEFTVYAWYRLTDLDGATATDAPLMPGRRVLAGSVFEQSYGQQLDEGATASITIPLANRCTEFRSTLGAGAGSADGFVGRWRLFADDDLALERTIGDGSTPQVTADITGTASLRLRSFALAAAGDAAWGNAEVLCAGRP